MTSTIRILIVEDHADFRQRLSALLQAQGDLRCAEVGDAMQAMHAIEQGTFDVVIMDINLQGQGSKSTLDGIDLTREIKHHHPATQVLICTVHEDEDKIFRALQAGASGYILKRAPLLEMIEAVRQVHRGESPMTGTIARKVVGSFRHAPLAESDQLTPQETRILHLSADGLKAKEIADKLSISVDTVRKHIRNVYEKLHVQNRVEMMRKAGRAR
jgi:DNA-binding NarL/FixJ family response regulator